MFFNFILQILISKKMFSLGSLKNKAKRKINQRAQKQKCLQSYCTGKGKGYPFQYSCLENSMDRGVWWATVHRVAKSQTWLSDFHFLSLHSWTASLDTSLKMLLAVSYIALKLWHKEQSRDTVCLHDTVQFSCSVFRGFTVHHQLPEFTQTHVHWVSDAIQPTHPLSFLFSSSSFYRGG